MSCKNIHFVSDFPVCLSVNEMHLGTLQNPYDTLSIEVDGENKLLLYVYPINSNHFFTAICYVAEIMIFENNIKTKSNYLEIANYDGTNFEIKVLPINVITKKEETIIQKIEIQNDMQAIIFDDGVFNIEITTKEKVFRYALKEKIYNTKCEYFEKNNHTFLFFSGKTQKNQDFLVVFNNFFCNLEIYANVIEHSQNEIKALTNQNDIAQHGIVQKYALNQNEFVLSDEYTVFLNNEPTYVNTPELIPWAFCEAVNISNIKLARFYLDSTLNTILSDEHILTFFGDYEEIKWNKYGKENNTICFLYGQQEKTCKKYVFELKENKITNITCLD